MPKYHTFNHYFCSKCQKHLTLVLSYIWFWAKLQILPQCLSSQLLYDILSLMHYWHFSWYHEFALPLKSLHMLSAAEQSDLPSRLSLKQPPSITDSVEERAVPNYSKDKVGIPAAAQWYVVSDGKEQTSTSTCLFIHVCYCPVRVAL